MKLKNPKNKHKKNSSLERSINIFNQLLDRVDISKLPTPEEQLKDI